MLEPFSLLPLALAATGGHVDDYEAQQLIAAGLTLLQRSAPLVRTLAGKRAAILLPTSPAFYTALAASEGRGAVLINPLAAPLEIAYQLADAGVGAVFTNSSLASAVPPNVPRVLLDDAPRSARVVVGGAVRDVDLGSHVGLTIEGDSSATGSDEEAAVVYTSAMQGIPLGAILSHRNLLANARATVQAAENTPGDTVLALLPFAHLFGFTVTGNAPLLAGARVRTMPRFNPARAAELLASGEITQVVGVPTVYRALLAALERRDSARLDGVRLCICGGSPLEMALQDRWFDRTGVELRQGYGLTEAGPVCLFNRADWPNARGTLGVPFPGVDVSLVAGEICVRGDNVFHGYVSGGDRGLQVVDGWLHTGDAARLNEDGTVAFAGVQKPMFTRNGFNIYPREIELALSEMPGVADARVTPQRTDDGELSIAVEVRGAVTEEAVRAWCARRLSGYKQPAVISVL
ncbi:MAG TPA: AMP-binding protein [Gemmatimonadaceae bacterium]|nr:AMP-binding protein [Gemmatimonadaceae bacterium]